MCRPIFLPFILSSVAYFGRILTITKPTLRLKENSTMEDAKTARDNQEGEILASDPFPRKRVAVLDSEIAYIDTGKGLPVVFVHGNPTSSYLWRNVIPLVAPVARCLAPDLIGMGDSGRSPSGSYRFVDHARYLDAWFEEMALDKDVTLVVHDWGSALGFHWAYRNPERVKAIIYMEALVGPATWDLWPEDARSFFQALRAPVGEKLILRRNLFVERVVPASVLRSLSEEEMAHYRKPYLEPGESRRPTLTWPREIPIDGEPEDVHAIVSAYGRWLPKSTIPKLFVNVKPGFFSPILEDHCRGWENQQEVLLKGHHFVQEDSPTELGMAIANFLTEIGP